MFSLHAWLLIIYMRKFISRNTYYMCNAYTQLILYLKIFSSASSTERSKLQRKGFKRIEDFAKNYCLSTVCFSVLFCLLHIKWKYAKWLDLVSMVEKMPIQKWLPLVHSAYTRHQVAMAHVNEHVIRIGIVFWIHKRKIELLKKTIVHFVPFG